MNVRHCQNIFCYLSLGKQEQTGLIDLRYQSSEA